MDTREIVEWLVTSEDVKAFYTLFLLGIMVLPMVGLSIWYHRGIGQTPGGRQLMADQNSETYRPKLHSPTSNAFAEFGKARALFTGIMSGRYGSDAKRRQIIVLKVCAIWLAAFAFFGALPFAAAWFVGL